MFLYLNILGYPEISELCYDGKPIIIRVHAIKRARERNIAFPDQVYNALRNGKVSRFAKHGVKFTNRTNDGSIICVGEDVGHSIIIKTVERGN